MVSLLSTVQPAAGAEQGKEPIGSAAGGTRFPLLQGEYSLSDTYQHPQLAC